MGKTYGSNFAVGVTSMNAADDDASIRSLKSMGSLDTLQPPNQPHHATFTLTHPPSLSSLKGSQHQNQNHDYYYHHHPASYPYYPPPTIDSNGVLSCWGSDCGCISCEDVRRVLRKANEREEYLDTLKAVLKENERGVWEERGVW
jgi:hypothetical protein